MKEANFLSIKLNMLVEKLIFKLGVFVALGFEFYGIMCFISDRIA